MAISPDPERRASEITLEESELARLRIIEAAVTFDAIEDGDPEVDWREGFGQLRDAAKALGNVNWTTSESAEHSHLLAWSL